MKFCNFFFGVPVIVFRILGPVILFRIFGKGIGMPVAVSP